jgi:glycolate oxidase
MDRARLVQGLSRLVGQHHVIHRPEQLLVYETDGLTAFHQMPEVVVLPETTDQVSSVLRFCYEHDVPFVPRDKGTACPVAPCPSRARS